MNDAAKQRMLDNVAFIRRRVKTLHFRLDGDDHDGHLMCMAIFNAIERILDELEDQ